MAQARSGSLDVLRGVAILGVVAVHCSESFPVGIPLVDAAIGLGRFGVQLFFLVSAFTMCLIWDRRSGERSPVKRFYLRRGLRIAPLFWLAIPVYLAINGTGPTYWAPGGVNVGDGILTATFLQGWWPSAINSIVPGGWSIAVEVTFYLIFPVLFRKINRNSHSYIIFSILFYILYIIIVQPILRPILVMFDPAGPIRDFLYLNPLSQAPVFLLGCGLYFMHQDSWKHWPLMLAWGGLALAFQVAGLERDPFVIVYLALALLAYTAIRLGVRLALLEALGRSSYSIYLSHFAVIVGLKAVVSDAAGPAAWALAFVATVVAAYVISIPMIRLLERPLHSLAENLTNGHPTTQLEPL